MREERKKREREREREKEKEMTHMKEKKESIDLFYHSER